MKEYFKTEYKPLLIGILAYCIFYAANELYGYMLIQAGIIKIDAANESSSWHPLLIFSNIITTLLLVSPGLLTGWFSKSKGIINGIVVILFCYIAKFFLFSVNLKIFFLDFHLFFVLFQHLITPVAVGAVSGAAGQFLRNKKSGL